jgi:hypothetical protein
MFIVEPFNDDEDFGFCERHRVYKAKALTLRQAMREALNEHPGWHVAQVRRPFADCKLPQPVYDAYNGLMFPEVLVDDPLSTWLDLMTADL